MPSDFRCKARIALPHPHPTLSIKLNPLFCSTESIQNGLFSSAASRIPSPSKSVANTAVEGVKRTLRRCCQLLESMCARDLCCYISVDEPRRKKPRTSGLVLADSGRPQPGSGKEEFKAEATLADEKKAAGLEVLQLEISGLDCADCGGKVDKALRRLPSCVSAPRLLVPSSACSLTDFALPSFAASSRSASTTSAASPTSSTIPRSSRPRPSLATSRARPASASSPSTSRAGSQRTTSHCPSPSHAFRPRTLLSHLTPATATSSAVSQRSPSLSRATRLGSRGTS